MSANERDGNTPNKRTKARRARRKASLAKAAAGVETPTWRQEQLVHLFKSQHGKCFVCGKPAVLDGNGGTSGSDNSAVRFRTGSSFGKKGRRRPRVMAHRGCADARSGEIQASVSVEERWLSSGREPTEFYEGKD